MAHQVNLQFFILYGVRHIRLKFGPKVFGKGFGEEPFLRKVFPDKCA